MNVPSDIQAAFTKIRSVKRKPLLDFMALGSMVLALVGASGISSTDWWPFAIIAAMFFIAGHLHLFRSFSIGPSGISGEMQESSDSPAAATRVTWKERDRLELYAIANISVGNETHDLPINRDPALSRFRLLKDAANAGQLHYEGTTPNAFATVTLTDFKTYAESTDIDDLKDLAEQWGQAKPKPVQTVREQARLRLAHLRTAGVKLRNSELHLEKVTDWALEVGDWALAVAAEIEKIDRADAEWFRTLDAVPPPRVNFVDLSPGYSKAFRELDFMLVKLERLITNYSSTHIRNAGPDDQAADPRI